MIKYRRLLIKYHELIKKEQENKSLDSMKYMMASLSQSIDKVSEIDMKISYAALIEKFLTHISYVIKILIDLLYY